MYESIIERQIGILRTILSDIAVTDKNGSEVFIVYIKKYFGFENDFGWNILMNAFYVYEDTELAKKDYTEFGLQGACRHRNIGEKYLRLYGILNALYQQFLALRNLMELFKLERREEFIRTFQESECIKLRNKIAAHSTNYSLERNSRQFDVYEISRPELEREDLCLVRNQEDFESYDLKLAIDEFDKATQQVLSKILEKFIKKKYKNKGKYFLEFQNIEKTRNGIIEIRGNIIEFEGQKK